MVEKKYSVTSGYRYGFNGQEKENEVKGEGNFIAFEQRIHDPRLGRFLSVDPLEKSYPSWTPYSYAMNDVIRCIDLEGAEKKVVIHWIDGAYNDGKPKITKTVVDIIKNIIYKEVYRSTGLPTGKTFAGTEVYYALPDGRFIQTETMYEEIGKDKPVPSAAYDYTQKTIPGKFEDDMSYITEGPKGFLPAFFEIGRRDSRAPDNAQTLEDLGGVNAALAVIGAPIRVGSISGSWIAESTNGWSTFSKAYQRQISGAEGRAFLLNGVKFDGITGQVLKEAKGRYAFILEKGWAQEGLLKQANSQIKAASGLKIEWHFAEKEAADAVKALFEKQGIKGIDVLHTPEIKSP
jgi:RHS repeat-associated protein